MDLSTMTSEDLDHLIAQAVKARAALEPKLPGERPTENVAMVAGPPWQIEPLSNGMMLQIGHPSFGWLSFLVSHADRANMLSAMLHQALLNPQKSGPDLPDAVAVPNAASIPSGGGKLH